MTTRYLFDRSLLNPVLDWPMKDQTIVAPETKQREIGEDGNQIGINIASSIVLLLQLPVPTESNVNRHYRPLDRAVFPMAPCTIHTAIALDANRRLQYRPSDHQRVATQSTNNK